LPELPVPALPVLLELPVPVLSVLVDLQLQLWCLQDFEGLCAISIVFHPFRMPLSANVLAIVSAIESAIVSSIELAIGSAIALVTEK
jgi:hypothetical protein